MQVYINDFIKKGVIKMAYAITGDCTGCTSCTTICPTGAISGQRKTMHKIDPEKCIHCGGCSMICPADAVTDSLGNRLIHVKRSQWPKPVISLEKCYSCGACAEMCPAGCIEMRIPESGPLNPKNSREEYAVFVHPKKCVSCGWCAEYCGFQSIEMKVPEPQKKKEEE